MWDNFPENLTSAPALSSSGLKLKTYHCLLSNQLRVYLFVTWKVLYCLFSCFILFLFIFNFDFTFSNAESVFLFCLFMLLCASLLDVYFSPFKLPCSWKGLCKWKNTESPNHHAWLVGHLEKNPVKQPIWFLPGLKYTSESGLSSYYGKGPWMLYSTNLSYTYQHTGTSSQTTGLAAMQHPWRNLEFSALFKGTLELFCEEPPFTAEYVALSQTFLQKGWSSVGSECSDTRLICDSVPCSRAL